MPAPTAVVADTHAAVWYLTNSPSLSGPARTAMAGAIAANLPVYVSVITLVELTYLIEKGKLPRSVRDATVRALQLPNSGFREVPFDSDIADALERVSRAEVPDLPDRMIAATALHLGLPLVTKDSQIRASAVPTIW